MVPLLVALSLSALPCGLTEEDLGEPCEDANGEQDLDAGQGGRLQCWERQQAVAEGVWTHEMTWLDAVACKYGRVVQGGAGSGSPLLLTLSAEPTPAGVTLSPELQASLTRALLPPLEDPKNPAHALAKVGAERSSWNSSEPIREQWWPGRVPQPSGTIARPINSARFGKCPCYEILFSKKFKLLREYPVGGQTVSVWGSEGRDQHLAVAVTDAGGKRHRWILTGYVRLGDASTVGHVEGSRWYMPAQHGISEQAFLLGYDAKTGQAWKVGLPPETSFGAVSDAGVELHSSHELVTRPWSSFGPNR